MKKEELFQRLIDKIKDYNPDFNFFFLEKAYKFAKNAHKGQERASGEEYIIHPLHTAINLTRIQADEITISAALLHDVPEDTHFTIEDLKKEFGPELALVVDGVTKISKIDYKDNPKQRQIDSFKKFFISSGKDFRTVLVKIADRLHNLQTLHFLKNEEKRIRIAKESLEIYSPILSLLSIGEFIGEFEDACFKHIHPKEYTEINNIFGKKEKFYKEKIEKIKEKVSSEVYEKIKKEIKISGRIKSLYSIFKKIKNKSSSLKNIHDVIALRIITKKTSDCYDILGVLHSIFKVKNDKFKDYISSPKNNGYQSLHTTIFDLDGEIIEFQIQTEEMRKLNKFGLASHFFYKNQNSNFSKTPNWIKNILDIQKNTPNSHSFFEGLKAELESEKMYCFTPNGEQINLPKKSTVLDFAYELHNDFGNKFKGAYINNEYTDNPIEILEDGDVVLLEKNIKKNTNYSINFIDIVKTNHTKNALRKLFRNESEEKKEKLGYSLLKTELQSFGLNNIDSLSGKKLSIFLEKCGCEKKEEFYSKIGSGDINLNFIVNKIRILNSEKNTRKKVHLKLCLKVIDLSSINYISKIFGELKIKISTFSFKKDYFILVFEVKNFKELKEILAELKRAPNIRKIKRIFPFKILLIYFMLFLTFILVLINPFIFKYFIEKGSNGSELNYGGFAIFTMIFLIIFLFKKVSQKILTDKHNRNIIQGSIILLNIITLGEIFWQSFYLGRFGFDSVVFLGFSLIILSILAFDSVSLKIEE